ncbi:MAG: peptidase C45, partial [Rubripirellula sp.]|nr:peptidase C45 [Rubripirellula sp.]
MIRAQLYRLSILAALLLAGLCFTRISLACTTAVISGKVTHDGRPILWKNRDTSFRHNELVLFEDGRYRVLAVVNAGSRKSVWMGVNETGFCIENSLSKDLNAENGDEESPSKSGLG